MALPSVPTSNFVGLLNISQDTFMQTDFGLSIPVWRDQIIINLLGFKAFTQIKNKSLDRWDTFFSGTLWEDEEGNEWDLLGVTDNVLAFLIYAKYVTQQQFVNTNTGIVRNLNENSIAANGGALGNISLTRQTYARDVWHYSVTPFINYYRTVKQEITAANGSGTVTVTTDSPADNFLEDGDTVKICDVEYEASNVTPTSFDVTATDSQAATFVGATATWHPFDIITSPIPDLDVGIL